MAQGLTSTMYGSFASVIFRPRRRSSSSNTVWELFRIAPLVDEKFQFLFWFWSLTRALEFDYDRLDILSPQRGMGSRGLKISS